MCDVFEPRRPYPVHVVEDDSGGPFGKGKAILVTDYGPEYSRLWTVVFDDGGEVWDVPNEKIRFLKNWSMGRTRKKPPQSAPANV